MSSREQAFARSLASITTLERVRGQSAGQAAGSTKADAAVAVARLHAVADSLEEELGKEHEEAKTARLNAVTASREHKRSAHNVDGVQGCALGPQWKRHWQPAVGAGIAAAMREPVPSRASTTQGNEHRWDQT
uniref:Uncharacterized protein n=1 Tax=Haptolina brevifila TaxID=156173 RepID=A0A7S2JEA5_9EUKA